MICGRVGFCVLALAATIAVAGADARAQTCCCFELGPIEWCEMEAQWCPPCTTGAECQGQAWIGEWRWTVISTQYGFSHQRQVPGPCYFTYDCTPPCENGVCFIDIQSPSGFGGFFPQNILSGSCPL